MENIHTTFISVLYDVPLHRCTITCFGFLGDSVVKNLPATQEAWVQSLGQTDFLEEEWQPTQVFLPGQSHGQRSLVGYSPQGRKRVQRNLATKPQQP